MPNYVAYAAQIYLDSLNRDGCLVIHFYVDLTDSLIGILFNSIKKCFY